MRHERELRLAGFERIAGIDEVGRGSLAGPVVAAAVILPERHRIKGLRDSKVVPRARREALYAQILDRAQSVGVGCVEVDVIDRINILQATKLAMTEALRRMPQQPDHLVIDALSLREVDLPQRPIIDGDAISASIAAASIVAKVTRDRICTELDARYPAYGFARNKGYGTRRHVEALLNEGPCEWHRRSFAPLRLLLAGEQLSLDLLFDEEMPTEDELDPADELAAGAARASHSSRGPRRGAGRRRLSTIPLLASGRRFPWPRRSNGSDARPRRRPPRGCRGAVGACLPGAGDRRPARSTWSAWIRTECWSVSRSSCAAALGPAVRRRRSTRDAWSDCEGRWPTMPRSSAHRRGRCGSTW